jgi:hypothetical protein
MRRTTGALAFWSAIGGDFMPLHDLPDRNGVGQGDGTYIIVMAHRDGRTLAIRTGQGDGWQPGSLVSVTAGGPWNLRYDSRKAHSWEGVRVWLADHEPGREEPYCGGPWPRQPRQLDGRERDILCRILSDIERALREGGDRQQQLLSVFCVEQQEVHRLLEMRVVLDARDD